jgi:hypothetical protein
VDHENYIKYKQELKQQNGAVIGRYKLVNVDGGTMVLRQVCIKGWQDNAI